MTASELVSALIACVVGSSSAYLWWGSRRIGSLADHTPCSEGALPPVTIVIAARNEEKNIREALQSVLSLTYPSYRIVVVNDRSEDNTPRILAEMQQLDSRLTCVSVETLPTGWLGKNHAQWIGSQYAGAEDILLFTDADVVMAPDTLSRAVCVMRESQADHLVLTPSIRVPSILLGIFSVFFGMVFALYVRPWQVSNPRSRAHVGIGAFNMVRGTVYRAIGGHTAIKMRPDDDIKLGKLIKQQGYQQEIRYAPEYLAVEWYHSTPELIRGLEKNTFAGAEYSVLLVVSGALAQLLITLWPIAGLFLTDGVSAALCGGIVAVSILSAGDAARRHRMPWYFGVGYPVAAVLFVYIVIRTMLLTLMQGGMYWRGTFYRLSELRKNIL